MLKKPTGTGKKSSFSGQVVDFFFVHSSVLRSRAGKNYGVKVLV